MQKGVVPVLFDPSGRRKQWFVWICLLVLFTLCAAAGCVLLSRFQSAPLPAFESLLLSWIFHDASLAWRLFGALCLGATTFGILRTVFLLILALLQYSNEKRRTFQAGFVPSVTVIMAAFDEEKVIVRSLESLLAADYPLLDIVVVDDGSRDRTLELLREAFSDEPRVRILHQRNAGKMAAMNRAFADAEGEIIVMADADTLFMPDAIGLLVRHFANERIGAVAAVVRIGNPADGILTRWQALEYSTCQNFDRRGYDFLNCIPVIAGAAGAIRREAVAALGGFSPETLNEDMDMTWQLLRKGWRIVNESQAIAYTEAPNTISSFLRQRFRWAFGTVQCLWKHRDALGRFGALGWIALPVQWLHQLLLPLLSPVVDLLILWSLFTGHFAAIASFAIGMLAIDAIAASVAVATGGGSGRLLPWLIVQRVGYHPLLCYVVIKAAVAAVCGVPVGWNKFARAGTAQLGGDQIAKPPARPLSAPVQALSLSRAVPQFSPRNEVDEADDLQESIPRQRGTSAALG